MSVFTFSQELLIAEGQYNGPISTSPSLKALSVMKEYVKDKVSDPSVLQSQKRIVVAYLQVKATEKGFDSGVIDGYLGPVTQYAVDKLIDLYERKDDAFVRPEDLPDVKFPVQYTKEFYQYYGDVNKAIPLGTVNCPYPLRIAWNTDQVITSFKAHVHLIQSIETILQEVLEEYGLDKIRELGLDLWGGCYNKRPIRGGKQWSIHSWGSAIDWDPARNQLKWGADKARMARPEYRKWWEIWEKHGWLSLGRKHNFDWMHVQAANTK